MKLYVRPLASALSAVLFGAVCCTPAFAQSNTGNANKTQPKQLQTVEVLGSRIKKSSLVSHTQVVTLTAKDIQNSGLATIGQVLQKLSVAGSSLTTQTDFTGNLGSPPDGSGVGAGAARISLRNLGPKRTLVLVDGLRWINGTSAQGVPASVDLNTIPLGAIARIQVLPDGASSLYGSDAIGGVVNIITKKTQNGGAGTLYYGGYSHGGGITKRYNLSFGAHTDNTQLFADVGHFSQMGIGSSHLKRLNGCFVPDTGTLTCSTDVPKGRFRFTTPMGNTLGGLCPGGICDISPNHPAGESGILPFPADFHMFGASDKYRFTNFLSVLSPETRSNLFVNVTHRLNNDVSVYLRGAYSTRSSSGIGAPEAIDLGPAVCTTGSASCNAVIAADNPYNPFGFALLPSDPQFGIQRRVVEGGPRLFFQRVQTRYFAGGFQGAFGLGDRNFNWDVNVVRSANDATQRSQGQYLQSHVLKAVGPLSVCQQSPQCVPLNLFGGVGSITPKQLKYIEFYPHNKSHQGLKLETADISGDVVKLPAGWLQFAAGYEHRTLNGSFRPDDELQNGDDGLPVLPTNGSFHVGSFYGELNVPLLKNVPLVKSLHVDLSMRHAHYSTFGNTNDRGVGIRWQLNDSFTVRGTWGQGFRAPAIGELFGPVTFFNQPLTDPCNSTSGLMATDPQVAGNCMKRGVKDPHTFQQNNLQIGTQTGGNPNLKPETSRDISYGFVYSPSVGWAQTLDVSAEYYHVEVRNAIEPPSTQTILDQCIETLASKFCSDVTRNAIGQITLIKGTLENLGRVDTDGADLNLDWVSNETGIGQFGVHWKNTYVFQFQTTNQNTGVISPGSVGVEVNDKFIPHWRSVLRTTWSLGRWSASWTARYISDGSETCANASSLFPICTQPGTHTDQFPTGKRHIGSVTYNDIRLTWAVPVGLPLSLSAGANNVLEHKPPLCFSCLENAYDAETYDVPDGRFWYVVAHVRF